MYITDYEEWRVEAGFKQERITHETHPNQMKTDDVGKNLIKLRSVIAQQTNTKRWELRREIENQITKISKMIKNTCDLLIEPKNKKDGINKIIVDVKILVTSPITYLWLTLHRLWILSCQRKGQRSQQWHQRQRQLSQQRPCQQSLQEDTPAPNSPKYKWR